MGKEITSAVGKCPRVTRSHTPVACWRSEVNSVFCHGDKALYFLIKSTVNISRWQKICLFTNQRPDSNNTSVFFKFFNFISGPVCVEHVSVTPNFNHRKTTSHWVISTRLKWQNSSCLSLLCLPTCLFRWNGFIVYVSWRQCHHLAQISGISNRWLRRTVLFLFLSVQKSEWLIKRRRPERKIAKDRQTYREREGEREGKTEKETDTRQTQRHDWDRQRDRDKERERERERLERNGH